MTFKVTRRAEHLASASQPGGALGARRIHAYGQPSSGRENSSEPISRTAHQPAELIPSIEGASETALSPSMQVADRDRLAIKGQIVMQQPLYVSLLRWVIIASATHVPTSRYMSARPVGRTGSLRSFAR